MLKKWLGAKQSAQAKPEESVDEMRRRAQHRLIGAVVLVAFAAGTRWAVGLAVAQFAVILAGAVADELIRRLAARRRAAGRGAG